MSFINELKRRNVIRVGILYLISSWLLLQLTDVFSSLLPVPEWTGSLVVLLLSLGFLPVLLFAWVYEMTPEGLKREKDIDRSESITPTTGHKLNTVIVVLLVIAIVGLVADRLVPESAPLADTAMQAEMAASQSSDDVSIAVLPFSDLSVNQDQQYFTDGLSEELLNLLVRVDELRVASRTSSFGYRDSTLGIPAIADALKVGHVLEGSVRKDGNRIRITAQLIEAGSDRHLWSENFDRDLVDIFAIQDEIANAIVDALTGKLGMDASPVVSVKPVTENLGAYELYLKARQLYINRERIDESIRLLHEAIDLDPNFARAWEGLAAAEILADSWIKYDQIEHHPLAVEAANRALELDPGLSTARAVLGLAESVRSKDISLGMRYYNEALEKDPKNATAHLWKGLGLHAAGYLADAQSHLEKCLQVDPGYLNCQQHLAAVLLNAGDTSRAMYLHDKTMEQAFHSVSHVFVPQYVRNGHRLLAVHIADAKLGHRNAPVIEWIRAIEDPGADNSAGFARLQDWERQQDIEHALKEIPLIFLAFDEFDELIAEGNSAQWVLWSPEADKFRRSPQFKQFIRQQNIFEYWREAGFPPQCRPIGSDDFECRGPTEPF